MLSLRLQAYIYTASNRERDAEATLQRIPASVQLRPEVYQTLLVARATPKADVLQPISQSMRLDKTLKQPPGAFKSKAQAHSDRLHGAASSQDAIVCDHSGATPCTDGKHLGDAAKSGCVRNVKKLLHEYPKSDAQLVEALFIAVESGNSSVVHSLIGANVDVNAFNKAGLTPLMCACEHNHEQVVRALLSANTRIDLEKRALPGKICSYSALHVAAAIETPGDASIANLLVDAGADVDVPDYWMTRPLHLAVKARNSTCVELLLAHGADINTQDHKARTPLHEAASAGNLDCAKILLARGADIEAQGSGGGRPLWGALDRAMLTGELACIELLLTHGADVNAIAGRAGDTPLHYLAWTTRVSSVQSVQSALQIAKVLLHHGANPGQANSNGSFPSHYIDLYFTNHESAKAGKELKYLLGPRTLGATLRRYVW